MPELPEVETVRKTLEEMVIGKRLEKVLVSWPKIIKKPDDTEMFCLLLGGQVIQKIGRRGKFLIFYLNDYSLVSHLRMEGKYEVVKEEPPDKHTHVRFFFEDDTELRYRDVRKFGTMHLFEKGEEMKSLPLKQLGPEPVGDASFTPEYLYGVFQKTTRNIKAVLLDQCVIAGLGNIYVDEALFKAGIRPDIRASTLDKDQTISLSKQITDTIAAAISKGGSSVRSYVNGAGDKGSYQLELSVYGREGEPCRRCGSDIEKTVTAGRGTRYCPTCQPVSYL
ncbi:DNA-formamidopyrimidine glycosylase [Alteribacillus iranensis]|uniref:Formamidopyrimidine-DNA glycosylase n=1 Tax=Alteribacillus iranensis TaxID=930128 RepID=A0A1I2CK78_9BACI|nr:DNA-formamidopyrimidine glycosylase [Alteribacillus iranensis]SFE68664.1 DNA-(apurinic or apyrimidinic site) lyase [Alteribacillus iranensis]